MSLSIGIVGLPNVGKSILLNAIWKKARKLKEDPYQIFMTNIPAPFTGTNAKTISE